MKLEYDESRVIFPRIERLLRGIERAGLWISSVCVVLLGLLVMLQVGLRSLGYRGIPDHNVLAGDLMVAIVALAWMVVTATRGHIEVEFFTSRVGERGRALLSALGGVVGLLMILPLAWASWKMLRNAVLRMTYYDGVMAFPQWPARLLFFAAFTLMAVRLTTLVIYDVSAFLRARSAAIPR